MKEEIISFEYENESGDVAEGEGKIASTVRIKVAHSYTLNGQRLVLAHTAYINGIWDFRLNDPDDWPSKPHGHNREKKLKINPFTGAIFDVQKGQKAEPIKTLKAKELQSLQEQLCKAKAYAQIFQQQEEEP